MRRFHSRVVVQIITTTFCVTSNGFRYESFEIIGHRSLSTQLQTRSQLAECQNDQSYLDKLRYVSPTSPHQLWCFDAPPPAPYPEFVCGLGLVRC
jgi:hypothetical protein